MGLFYEQRVGCSARSSGLHPGFPPDSGRVERRQERSAAIEEKEKEVAPFWAWAASNFHLPMEETCECIQQQGANSVDVGLFQRVSPVILLSLLCISSSPLLRHVWCTPE